MLSAVYRSDVSWAASFVCILEKSYSEVNHNRNTNTNDEDDTGQQDDVLDNTLIY